MLLLFLLVLISPSYQSSQCSFGEFSCSNKCIKAAWLCDGDKDCEDGSDERYCGGRCSTGEFYCPNECITRENLCDGVYDCEDGSDERNCGGRCSSAEFSCPNKCVSRDSLCDGVNDCEDGSDEKNCSETVVFRVEAVTKSRNSAISWLKKKRTDSWGWRENTHRAIVALYLANDAHFNGSNKEEELMAKQLQLEAAIALLRDDTDPLLPNQLSMFVNSLLTVCFNPRKFHGYDLLKLLKDQLKSSQTIPVAYLSLCNANEPLPEDTIPKLKKILTTSSEYPFLIDFQAMTIIALSCMKKQNINLVKGNITIMEDYNTTIKRFISLQHQDGSFGNVHTTALVTQALLCSEQENNKKWKLNATIKYLMAQLNSSSVDFFTTYLTLPILNGKCLADISKINCSGNPRSHRENELDDIKNKLGPKMQVQYSLYVGDKKDIIYTISLRVPENITAFEVMEIAAAADAKYKFKSKRLGEKIYVYEIAGISNDSEDGKFWLLYKDDMSHSADEFHYTESPDEIIMQDQESLIMWYKTVNI